MAVEAAEARNSAPQELAVRPHRLVGDGQQHAGVAGYEHPEQRAQRAEQHPQRPAPRQRRQWADADFPEE